MIKRGFILILVLLLVFPFISALPPTQTNVNIEQGLEIQYPPINVLKANESFEFQFHVFNKSDGLRLSNDTTSCVFHLYNSSGAELIDFPLAMAINLIDFQIIVEPGNFSVPGSYGFIVQCNTSALGGFIGIPIEVSKTGQLLETSESLLNPSYICNIFYILLLPVLHYHNSILQQEKCKWRSYLHSKTEIP